MDDEDGVGVGVGDGVGIVGVWFVIVFAVTVFRCDE